MMYKPYLMMMVGKAVRSYVMRKAINLYVMGMDSSRFRGFSS